MKCTYRCTYVCGHENSNYKLEIVGTSFQSSVDTDGVWYGLLKFECSHFSNFEAESLIHKPIDQLTN